MIVGPPVAIWLVVLAGMQAPDADAGVLYFSRSACLKGGGRRMRAARARQYVCVVAPQILEKP